MGRERIPGLLLEHWKPAAFLLSLTLVLAFERIARWRAFPSPAARWRRNVPLALVDAGILAVVCGGCAVEISRWAASAGIGLFNVLPVPRIVAIGFTIAGLDLISYLWHRANHRLSFLWRFHAVHHSDPVFDASTSFRFHPGELLLALPVRLGAVVLLGAPVAGLVIFEVTFGFFNLFVHGNIRLPDRMERIAESLVVHPAMHRAHHSQVVAESNSNYGTIFSVWDRLFRTLFAARSTRDVRIGLDGVSAAEAGAVLSQLWMPVRTRAPADP